MSAPRKKPRWAVLAGGLVLSVIVGSALGRAYRSRAEAEPPAAFDEGDEDLLKEALDLEREPRAQAPLPEVDAARKARVAENLATGGRTGQAALRHRMPLPPKSGALVSIGEQLDAHGVPMNLGSFETELSAKDVLDFYARHFEAEGWPYSDVPTAKELVPYPALSATVFEEELQLTVMVMPHGDDAGNTVVLGLADMKAYREGTARENTGDLPVYPGTSPVSVRSRDEGSAALIVSFDTTDAPKAVEDFYRKELAQRGYSEVADAREPGNESPRMLNFAARGRSWRLALSAQGAGTAVTAQGIPAQEATR